MNIYVVFVQSLSHVWLFVTPWTEPHQASLSCTISQSLLKLMSIELVMPSNHLILSFTFSPSNKYSGLISFTMDWLDLLEVQGTLPSLLQHHSSKASILWCSAFFIFQLSHPYMTVGKTIALIRCTFVGKVISLLFNMFSRLAITFLPRSKRLLIAWLQSPSAVTWSPRK